MVPSHVVGKACRMRQCVVSCKSALMKINFYGGLIVSKTKICSKKEYWMTSFANVSHDHGYI